MMYLFFTQLDHQKDYWTVASSVIGGRIGSRKLVVTDNCTVQLQQNGQSCTANLATGPCRDLTRPVAETSALSP